MNNKFMKKVTSAILLCTVVAYTTPIFAYTKEEAVYSKLDTNGKTYETIVSNHLINSDQDSIINDISDLFNIKNVNGSEAFTQDGNNIIWNSNGNDIYYQGKSSKALPIECSVHYELDGIEISAKDLAGKSGKVKVIIRYINKDEHIVNINGKNEKMYTPFVSMCGTIINNEKNKNIKISNGKVIDDGSKTIVVGLALPGLKESLSLSNDTIDIPDTIEITMDSTNFEFGSIYNFVTPKVLEDTDLEIFDNLDEIYSKVNTLQTSSKQLVSGANTLKDGTKTYLENSKQFNSAMKEVSNGMNEANTNYSKIDSGISLLNKNSSTLTEGTKKISEGTEALAKGADIINNSVGKLENGSETLYQGLTKLSGLATTMKVPVQSSSSTSNNSSSTIEKNDTGSNNSTNSEEPVKPEIQYTDEYAFIVANTSAIQALSNMDPLGTNPEIQTIIAGLNKENVALKQALPSLSTLTSGAKQLSYGLSDLKEGSDTLAKKSEELAEGSKTLYEGTLTLASGTKTLTSGSSELKKGLNTLNNGTTSLLDANNRLVSGADTISNGAKTLADGMTKFDKEGISSICNYLNGDVKDISARLEKLQKLAEEYNNFAGINDEVTGNVKFIMIIDGIKNSYNQKENAIINNKNEND